MLYCWLQGLVMPAAGPRTSPQPLRAPHPLPPTLSLGPRSDLLHAYAALQQFKVKPVAKSQCYTGDRLLEQFGFPHQGDAAVVAKAYPWLRGYDGGCKAAQAVWGAY